MPIVLKSVTNANGNTGTLTFNHTVDAASNAIFVGVSIRNSTSQTVTGVAWFGPGDDVGVAFTVVKVKSNGTDVRAEIWELLDPAITGAGQITVTLSATAKLVAGAIDLSGVDNTAIASNTASNSGNDQTVTLTLTSTLDTSLCFDTAAVEYGSLVTLTVGGSQTQRWNDATGTLLADVRGAGSTIAGNGSITMTWAIGGVLNRQWASVACEILASKGQPGQLAQIGVGQ